MRAACADEGLYATDLAEALVRAGVPFRDAHRRTGELLRGAEADGRTLAELTAEEWEAFGVPEGAALFDADRSVAARNGPGGPSRESVRDQAEALDAIFA
jgi:argininosuccinate lyase